MIKKIPLTLCIVFLFSTHFANSATDFHSKLVALYPELTPDAFDAKLKSAEDPFEFFRSFVVYYYDQVKTHQNHVLLFKNLYHYSGWCVGDAHPENFGPVGTLFSINDLDDSGPCPISVDFLRFLISAKLKSSLKNNSTALKIQNLISSYQNGLNAKRFLKAPIIKESNQPEKKYFDSTKIVLKRSKESFEIDSVLKQKISDVLQRTYRLDLNAEPTLLDVFERKKIQGGSGGLKRYIALIQTGSNPPAVIEFKETIQTGIWPVATEALPSPKERLEKSLELFYGKQVSSLYQTIEFDGHTFLLRPRVEIQYPVLENQNELLKYEAYTLGKIHRRTAKNPKQYLRSLKKINLKQWNQAIDFFIKTNEKAYLSTRTSTVGSP